MIRRAVTLLALVAFCAPVLAQDGKALPMREFIRVEQHPERQKVVRASVRVYTAPTPDPKNSPLGPMAGMLGGNRKAPPRPEVVLVSMVHYGEKAYFQQVNQVLATADVVLYEEQGDQMLSMVGPDAFKDLTDLAFQGLEVKLDPKTARSADLTQEQTFQALGVDPSVMKRMSKMMKQMGNLKLDRKTLERMPGMAQMIPNRQRIVQTIEAGAGMTDANAMPGKMGDLILRQRNAIAVGELTRASYETDKKRIVLIYGAAHMSGVEAYLTGPLGYTHKSTEWIDAVYQTAEPVRPAAPAPAQGGKGGAWY